MATRLDQRSRATRAAADRPESPMRKAAAPVRDLPVVHVLHELVASLVAAL
jgi:hypothetical protein